MIIQRTKLKMDLQTEIMNYLTRTGIATVQEIRYYTLFKFDGKQIGKELKKLVNSGIISRNGKEYILNK